MEWIKKVVWSMGTRKLMLIKKNYFVHLNQAIVFISFLSCKHKASLFYIRTRKRYFLNAAIYVYMKKIVAQLEERCD